MSNRADPPEFEVFKNLDELGYMFNEAGKLVGNGKHGTKAGEDFNFNFYDRHDANQRRYEVLGLAVERHVYELLELHDKLVKVDIEGQDKGGRGFFFMSKDVPTNEDHLLILIHGSGVVRAGQWSRRLIINHSLESGSQLPYIERALKEGWAVLVLNTNQNYDDDNSKPIENSRSPEEHARYVWEHVVFAQSKAKHITIVAHSYGGAVTVSLLDHYLEEFQQRVCAIAFTDSVHWYGSRNRSEALTYFKKVARNWVTSPSPLDVSVRYSKGDCACVSAGTTVHEETSWKSIESVFKFMNEKARSREGSSVDMPGSGREGSQTAEQQSVDNLPVVAGGQNESFAASDTRDKDGAEENCAKKLCTEDKSEVPIPGNEQAGASCLNEGAQTDDTATAKVEETLSSLTPSQNEGIAAGDTCTRDNDVSQENRSKKLRTEENLESAVPAKEQATVPSQNGAKTDITTVEDEGSAVVFTESQVTENQRQQAVSTPESLSNEGVAADKAYEQGRSEESCARQSCTEENSEAPTPESELSGVNSQAGPQTDSASYGTEIQVSELGDPNAGDKEAPLPQGVCVVGDADDPVCNGCHSSEVHLPSELSEQHNVATQEVNTQ